MKWRLLASLGTGIVALAVTGVRADGDHPNEVRINLDTLPPPASTKPVAKPAPKPASKSTKAAAPVTKTSKTTKPAAKADTKATEQPKIEGMEIARGDHGFLGLKIVDGVFKLTFYDKDKKAATPDVSRAVLRWPVHYQPNDERTLLELSADGKSLTSGKIVRPPYSFKLYMTLLKDDPAGGAPVAVESYVVDFQQ